MDRGLAYQHGGDIYTNKDMLDFSANINFRGIPERVRKATIAAVEDSVHYPDARCMELKCAIAQMEGVPEKAVFCGNGAADVIFSLTQAVRPKRALLPVPSFFEYRQALEAVDCEIISDQMREAENISLQKDIFEKITSDMEMFFLCNPNNPTGLLTERDLMIRILDKCERTGTLLVVDECFMDLTEEPEQYSMMPEIKDSDCLFILKAFTKSYAMPGLRLGYGISRNEELLWKMERASQPWRVSVPAQAAGVAAAAEQEYLRESRLEIGSNRKKMIEALREMGLEAWDSAANFVFFRGNPGLAEAMKGQGILIRDCENFDGLEAGYYRVAVRSEAENRLLLNAMRKIL